MESDPNDTYSFSELQALLETNRMFDLADQYAAGAQPSVEAASKKQAAKSRPF